MKDITKQIQFIDQFMLHLYGIDSLADFNSKISVQMLKKEKKIIDEINKILPKIKKLFPVKDFSLHKTDNKVKSYQQAFGMLKICLRIARIPFEIVKIGKINYLCLNGENIYLKNYINRHKMSEIRENGSIIVKELSKTLKIRGEKGRN
jgi:hypothetical protein